MNDDLISRRTIKFLIETIRDCWAISPYVSANDMKLYLKVFIVVLTEISNCPTAFDKEKVIKELREELNLSDAEKERCARENPLQFDSAKGYANGIANAIEIVEKGGLE